MLDCHERIRGFLATAQRISQAQESPGDEVADAAGRVRRYFTDALPLHAQDEDVSILPRLRGFDPEVDRALEEMRREHVDAEASLARLTGLCATIEHNPASLADLGAALGGLATELEDYFAGHLEREERIIFPAFRRAIDVETSKVVMKEIRARRARA